MSHMRIMPCAHGYKSKQFLFKIPFSFVSRPTSDHYRPLSVRLTMTHWLGHDARSEKILEILSWSDTWSWTWLTSWLRTLNLIWFLANNYGFYKTRMGINVKLTITRSLVQVKNFFLLEDLQGHVIIMWSIMWYITW